MVVDAPWCWSPGSSEGYPRALLLCRVNHGEAMQLDMAIGETEVEDVALEDCLSEHGHGSEEAPGIDEEGEGEPWHGDVAYAAAIAGTSSAGSGSCEAGTLGGQERGASRAGEGGAGFGRWQ